MQGDKRQAKQNKLFVLIGLTLLGLYWKYCCCCFFKSAPTFEASSLKITKLTYSKSAPNDGVTATLTKRKMRVIKTGTVVTIIILFYRK